MDNISILPLFVVPLYCNDIIITEEEKQFIKAQPFVAMRDGTAFYTKNNYILEDNFLVRLKQEIDKNITNYVTEVYKIDTSSIEFYITTSWCNKFKKSQHGFRHEHRNSIFSGVFYIDAAPDSGQLSLENPVQSLPSPTFQFDYTDSNMFNSRVWAIDPKDNLLILFPSNIMHSIKENTSNTDRYSVAFNVFVKGILGDHASELKI